jgi:hypothetical protein
MVTGALSCVWCLSQLLASFCRPFAWHCSAAASEQIFMKFDNEVFFENVLKKIQV